MAKVQQGWLRPGSGVRLRRRQADAPAHRPLRRRPNRLWWTRTTRRLTVVATTTVTSTTSPTSSWTPRTTLTAQDPALHARCAHYWRVPAAEVRRLPRQSRRACDLRRIHGGSTERGIRGLSAGALRRANGRAASCTLKAGDELRPVQRSGKVSGRGCPRLTSPVQAPGSLGNVPGSVCT